MLWFAVPCCATLCYTVLYFTVLCWAVQCCAELSCTVVICVASSWRLREMALLLGALGSVSDAAKAAAERGCVPTCTS